MSNMQEVNEKLGEDKVKQMDDLFGFNLILNNELSKDSCSDEMRKMISDKLVGIKKAIDMIQDATKAKHFSPDTKAKLISEALESVNLDALKSEILDTKNALQRKMKSIARNTKDRVISSTNALESSIQDNIRLVKEEKARAIKSREELNKEAEELTYVPRRERSEQIKENDKTSFDDEIEKFNNMKIKIKEPKVEIKSNLEASDDERNSFLSKENEFEESLEYGSPDFKATKVKDKNEIESEELKEEKSEMLHKKKNLENEYKNVVNDKEAALSLYKEKGFFSTFRRVWEYRKNVDGKKMGFFGVLKETCFEYYYNRDDAKANKRDAATFENQRIDLDNRIGKCEERIRALNKQLKDVKKECGKAGKDCLEKCKSRLDNAVQSSPKQERYEEMGRRIEEFSKTVDRMTGRDR